MIRRVPQKASGVERESGWGRRRERYLTGVGRLGVNCNGASGGFTDEGQRNDDCPADEEEGRGGFGFGFGSGFGFGFGGGFGQEGGPVDELGSVITEKE